MFDFLFNLPILIIILFFILIGVLLIFTSTTLINIIFGPYLRNAPQLKKFPKVSVLVPARNEENNIRPCIESLINQDYPNYEIIILDDNSVDKTYLICEEYLKFDRVKLIRGGKLLDGWLGKNNACRQLADSAQGEILIFTDADNFYNTNAISNTVSLMNKHKLGMLSAFPEQKTSTFFEKLIVPLIDLIVYSGLILWSSLIIPSKIFAAANGQWIAFTRESYNFIGGHESVKNHIVEDVALSRIAKSKKVRVLVCAGTDIVFGKMYSNFSEIWQGLSKNIYGLTDFKPIPFFLLLSLIFACCLLPYLLLIFEFLRIPALILISVNLFCRLSLAVGFRHNILISIFLHPISIILLLAIGINSYYQSTFGSLTWKGRIIRISK